MSVAIWARKTVALGLTAMLAGPSVSLLSAQEAQGESQQEKRARRQQQAEKQQEKQQAREQEQAQRRAQREEQAQRRSERAQQEQQQRQRGRDEQVQRQQEHQAEQQRQRQEQRQVQEQRQRERAQQLDHERAARQAEQAQRRQQAEEAQRRDQVERAQRREQAERRQAEQGQRQQSDQVQRQRDVERRQRRSGQARVEEQARVQEQARVNERARQSERIGPEAQRGQSDALRRQPIPRGDRAVRHGERLSEARRGEIIRENRERSQRVGERWSQRERWGRQRTYELQNQRRYAQYRYQQRYWERMRQQWRHNDWRRYDYNRDPFFSYAPSYRYRYAGRYYEINDYGADLLREAVNRGYEEGFLAGQADREDRWHGNYRDSYVYQDASYGYRGLYVDEEQYGYYFREGFDRGYADGYNSRYEYGHRDNTGLKVLAAVLAGILIFEAID